MRGEFHPEFDLYELRDLFVLVDFRADIVPLLLALFSYEDFLAIFVDAGKQFLVDITDIESDSFGGFGFLRILDFEIKPANHVFIKFEFWNSCFAVLTQIEIIIILVIFFNFLQISGVKITPKSDTIKFGIYLLGVSA